MAVTLQVVDGQAEQFKSLEKELVLGLNVANQIDVVRFVLEEVVWVFQLEAVKPAIKHEVFNIVQIKLLSLIIIQNKLINLLGDVVKLRAQVLLQRNSLCDYVATHS